MLPTAGVQVAAEMAVTNPLPLTVAVMQPVTEPNVPTLALTVASVVASDAPGVVMSPVRAGKLAAGSAPLIVDVVRFTVKPVPVAPPVSVPTAVRDDVTTVLLRVVPVSVPAGAALSG